MAEIKVKKRPDGKWELVDEPGKVFDADDREEAERLAKAYLEKGGQAVKRVAREELDKAKTSVVSKR
jgi:hypothetical protein